MATAFHPENYLRLPQTDVPTALTFAHKVRAAAPKKLPPATKKALASLDATSAALQAAWTDADRAGRVDRRPIDNAADVAWGSLADRLDAYGRLPADRYPRSARAQALHAALFPDGTAFLKSEYDTQWAEMHKRVERIKSEGLRAELEQLCGADHVSELLRTYDDYGYIVGVVAPGRDHTPAPSLVDPLRAVMGASTDYALQLLAWHQDGDDEARSQVRAALVPYDELRDNATRARRAANSPEPAPPLGSVSEPANATAPAPQAPVYLEAASATPIHHAP